MSSREVRVTVHPGRVLARVSPYLAGAWGDAGFRCEVPAHGFTAVRFRR